MKTDSQPLRDAQDQLRWEPSIRDDGIGVAAKDGVLTLSGHVPSYADKCAAVRAVERVRGVKAAADEIAVKLPSSHTRTGTELAHEAVNALKWDVSQKIRDTLRRSADLDADRITVETHDGSVTLKGTVRSFADRRDAERAAWGAPSVTRVDDRILVGPCAEAVGPSHPRRSIR